MRLLTRFVSFWPPVSIPRHAVAMRRAGAGDTLSILQGIPASSWDERESNAASSARVQSTSSLREAPCADMSSA
jgi:hypothetical protein